MPKPDDKEPEKEPSKTEPDAPDPKEPAEPAVVATDDDGNVTVKRESRQDRRTKRYDELAREREEFRAKAERLEREVGEARGMAQAAQAAIAAERSRIQQSQQRDPWSAAISDIRGRQERIQAVLRSGQITTESEIEKLKAEYYAEEDKHRELLERRIVERVRGEVSQQHNPAEYEAQILRSEYPDVADHQKALEWATGFFRQMVAEGKPANINTSRAALKAAGEKFGIIEPSVPAPSASQQARYGAVSAQAGGNGQSEGVRLDRSAQRMAMAMYPSLPEEEAFRKWAVHKERWEKSQQDDKAS